MDVYRYYMGFQSQGTAVDLTAVGRPIFGNEKMASLRGACAALASTSSDCISLQLSIDFFCHRMYISLWRVLLLPISVCPLRLFVLSQLA